MWSALFFYNAVSPEEACMVRPDLGGLRDEELLLEFQRGDAQAFEILVQRYRRGIYNFLLRSTREPEAAADLYQEVFLRVVHRSGTFKENSKFSSWLYAIARNICIDHSRRMSHRRHRSLDAPTSPDTGGGTMLDRVGDSKSDVGRSVVSGKLRIKIATAVEELPHDQREVFLMRQIQGMAFQDIADTVEVPLNTVKSRMRYALERLRAELGDYESYAKDMKI